MDLEQGPTFSAQGREETLFPLEKVFPNLPLGYGVLCHCSQHPIKNVANRCPQDTFIDAIAIAIHNVEVDFE